MIRSYIHSSCQIFHKRYLPYKIHEGISAKYRTKEFGWICEAFTRPSRVLAKLVILPTQIVVAQHLICLADGLELCVGGLIAGILICRVLEIGSRGGRLDL